MIRAALDAAHIQLADAVRAASHQRHIAADTGRAALYARHRVRAAEGRSWVSMPWISGLKVLEAFRGRAGNTPVSRLTTSLTSVEAVNAIQGRVDGLVLKESVPRQRLQRIASVCAGERWICPEAGTGRPMHR